MLRVKHLVLGNKSTRCMDEFIQCVHELFTATEDFVVTYLRKQLKQNFHSGFTTCAGKLGQKRNIFHSYSIHNWTSTNSHVQRKRLQTTNSYLLIKLAMPQVHLCVVLLLLQSM